ncbi:MAG: hypothetical protein AB7S75_13625 [Desulfococcaceae bacterium]
MNSSEPITESLKKGKTGRTARNTKRQILFPRSHALRQHIKFLKFFILCLFLGDFHEKMYHIVGRARLFVPAVSAGRRAQKAVPALRKTV